MPEHDDLEFALPVEILQTPKRWPGDEHQFFAEDDFLYQIGVLHGAGNEGAIQPVLQHVGDQPGAGAGGDDQSNRRVGPRIGGEDRRQPQRRRRLERADAQRPARDAIVRKPSRAPLSAMQRGGQRRAIAAGPRRSE